MKTSINRRRLMALGGALGSAALLPRLGFAQQQLVVGTFGGDTQKTFEEAVVKPILEPKGITAVMEAAPGTTRRLKLLAEKRLPRGTYDVVNLISSMLYELDQQELFEELDTTRLPFYGNLYPNFQNPKYIPNMATATVILYNPQHVTTPPTSYADLWNPKYAGKVGFVDFDYGWALAAGSLINGGSMSDYEPGKEKLLELKKSGVMVYPSNEALGQAIQTGECWMALLLQSRGIQWKRGGVPVEIAYPKEGVVNEWWGLAIPKNATNKDAAYEFINAALSDEAQKAWAHRMWAMAPTVNATDLVDAEARSLLATPEDIKRLKIDDNYWAKNDAQFKEWWDRVFKA